MDVIESPETADSKARYASGVKWYRVCKRVTDVLIALGGLALLWPLMLLIAAVIVADSPGAGPIFTQTRVGQYGKEFTIYKFRTMCSDAEEKLTTLLPYNEMEGPVFKLTHDPRVTKFGQYLRASCLDELPQLWNVLIGDMSIVGPRPGLPREVAQYDDRARQRLTVMPGLTCYWQIQPRRNKMSFEKWMDLDLQYIRECGMMTDWKIILATIRAVLGMNGV